MRFLKKLKSGNFWVSIISAGVLIAEVVFDFEIKTEYLNQILLGILGLLTMCGIITDHGEKETILQNTTQTENPKQDGQDNFSNIKSICDTISLMLNKVSINSNANIQNDKGDKMSNENFNQTTNEDIFHDNQFVTNIETSENLNNNIMDYQQNLNNDISTINNENLNNDISTINDENLHNDELENNDKNMQDYMTENSVLGNCEVADFGDNDIVSSSKDSSKNFDDEYSNQLNFVDYDCNQDCVMQTVENCEETNTDMQNAENSTDEQEELTNIHNSIETEKLADDISNIELEDTNANTNNYEEENCAIADNQIIDIVNK